MSLNDDFFLYRFHRSGRFAKPVSQENSRHFKGGGHDNPGFDGGDINLKKRVLEPEYCEIRERKGDAHSNTDSAGDNESHYQELKTENMGSNGLYARIYKSDACDFSLPQSEI